MQILLDAQIWYTKGEKISWYRHVNLYPILLSIAIATSSIPFHPLVQMISDTAVLSMPLSLENIHRVSDFYADFYNIPTSTMNHIIKNESGWNQYAVGDNGHSKGLVQIYDKYHPEITDTQKYSVFFSLNFLASNLAKGNCKLWSTCPAKAVLKE